MEMYPTAISTAHWCKPDNPTRFQPACVQGMGAAPEGGTSWLDALFLGGIYLPDPADGRAVTMLLSGPPGMGKSTLATELCYRWAQRPAGKRLRSLYITTEAHEPWLIANAKAFGWNSELFSADTEARVSVKSMIGQDPRRLLRSGQGRVWESVLRLHDPMFKGSARNSQARTRDVVVVDSLNTVPSEQEREKLFSGLLGLVTSGPRLVILVLDSPQDEAAGFWEFASDIVIRLDRQYISDYMVRNIEIVKSRYQPAVWGRHQIKIYEKPTDREPRSAAPDQADRTRLMRAFPFRREGGIHVYPSIHFVVSKYKRSGPDKPSGDLPALPKSLNQMLGKGFPQGHCTALLGSRGGHKSHLGFLQLLGQITDQSSNQKAIVVSLRDDEGVTRATMQRILDDEWRRKRRPVSLSQLEQRDRLEIMYYPPGYITPAEFFHRLLLSINRMKQDAGSNITLLFNSLDQLGSRFPLCAKEDMFVPGILQMLKAEEVTSFFVAAQEPGRPPEYYGLESIAELILSFARAVFPRDQYCKYLRESMPAQESAINKQAGMMDEDHEAVVLRVLRFSGGQAAGAGGILELVGKEGTELHNLYGSKGLHFVPLTSFESAVGLGTREGSGRLVEA